MHILTIFKNERKKFMEEFYKFSQKVFGVENSKNCSESCILVASQHAISSVTLHNSIFRERVYSQ